MKSAYAIFLFCWITQFNYASVWFTHLHDNNRSAQTNETLPLPLNESWQFQSAPPQYAWDDPAQQDYWHNAANLKPRMIFDRAHYTVSANGKVYFGSTVDDQIYCLSAESGEIIWRYYTNAPVRLPPTLFNNKVYAGSDDGNAYCLNAETGDLIWKYTASTEARMLPGNEGIISPWAIRTGVLIDNGTAYFASGLFPEEKVYLCALQADSGSEIWKHEIPYSPQGNLLTSEDYLFVPTGRSTPLIFNKTNGEFIKQLTGNGGSYAVLSKDQLIYGPGLTGQLSTTSKASQIATFSGNHMIVTPSASYLHTDTELSAIDRNRYIQLKSEEANLTRNKAQIEHQLEQAKQNVQETTVEELTTQLRNAQTALSELQIQLQKCILWNIPCAHSYSLIRAGTHLFAGGENTVAAYNASTGKEVWRTNVNGKAYGLTVANQKLIVSTDQGSIHCFSINPVDHPIQTTPSKNIAFDFVLPSSYKKDQKGYAVIIGWDQQDVENVLIGTDCHIVVVEKNVDQVKQARTWLQDRNLYGKRVVVLPGSIQDYGFTNYFANIVSTNYHTENPWDESELLAIKNIVRPNGGRLFINTTDQSEPQSFFPFKQNEFKPTKHILNFPDPKKISWKFERSPLPNTGEWTHLYANAGNTASSGDETITQNMRLQWFGRPGHRQMIDRHLRPPSPLAKDGRLFIPANDQIIAADAYNGTVLWQNQVPGFRRVGIPYDVGNMVLTENLLFAVADKVCLGFDPASGIQTTTLHLPIDIQKLLPNHEWGYIAYSNGIIIGSAQPPDASRTELSREDVVEQYETFRPLATSDALFLHDVKDGANRIHQNGKIINTSIAANNSSVYFIECQSGALHNNQEGKIPLSQLFSDNITLVALNIHSGESKFRIPLDIKHIQHIVYLSCSEDVITITGSYNKDETHSVWYSILAFDAKTGKELWRHDHENNRKGVGGDHGEQVHHPVILKDKIIAEPLAYDLVTGKIIQNNNENWYLPSRGGCGTVSASANCLFYRNSNPMIFDFNAGGDAKKLSSVNRPGCWINMIPASGLVLVPEASSGCTCNFSIQTSMAFIPR
jgi:outer membrane protein assembly factor BamB